MNATCRTCGAPEEGCDCRRCDNCNFRGRQVNGERETEGDVRLVEVWDAYLCAACEQILGAGGAA